MSLSTPPIRALHPVWCGLALRSVFHEAPHRACHTEGDEDVSLRRTRQPRPGPRLRGPPARQGDPDVRLGGQRSDRSGRGDAEPGTRHVHRGDGAVRVGQVHAAPVRGGPRPAGQRHRVRGRQGADGWRRGGADEVPARPGRVRLPAVQPAGDADRRAEHGAAAQAGRAARRPEAGAGGPDVGRSRGPARPPSRPALRRSAAAGGDRKGAGHRTAGDLRGRADGRPGHAQRPSGAAAAPGGGAGARADRGDGDARPGRRVVRRLGGLPRRRPAGGADGRADPGRGRGAPRPPGRRRAGGV